MSVGLTITVGSTPTAVPAPSDFKVALNPQQKSAERNSNGTLVRETLPDKWTLELEWKFSRPEDTYAWFNYLKTLTRINFTVQFPAPSGNMETATFYMSPVSAEILHFGFGTAGFWRTLKTKFVEV